MIPEIDIVFDDFGDVVVNNGNLETTSDIFRITKQNAIDRIRSSYGDYRLYPTYGANLSAKIGKPIGATMELEIEQSIIRSLTFDGFLQKQDIKCVAINIGPYEILTKTEIKINKQGYLLTSLTINSTFNTINGVINVY